MRRFARKLAAAGMLLALAGCEFGEETVGTGRARPVVHAVLAPMPFGDDWVVLLERTLTGAVDTRSNVRDPADPIASGGGDPISQANVVLTRIDGPSGPPAVGIEDAAVRQDGKGRGVYRFVNAPCGAFSCPVNGIPIVQGRRYRLRITLPGGQDVIEGETTLPIPTLAPDSAPVRLFDRERDTLRLTWPAAAGAHRYVLQVQTPYGPIQLFTDTNAITVSGGLRNFQVDRIPLVFTPGFLQAVQIAAVDTNYFEYYRSRNDPFTGSGLLSRLRGGTGLFGSYAPIRRTAFEVVAPQDEPIEGLWNHPSALLTLYALDAGQVSGRYDDVLGERHGVLGIRTGNRMRLAVLRAQRLNDTMFTADAEVVADTLILRHAEGGEQRFRRVPIGP